MINPGLVEYEVVLDNEYFLRELTKSITLEDSIDEIAYRANIRLVRTPDFPAIRPGQPIRVSGVPGGGDRMVFLLHPAVVWSVESEHRGQKYLDVTALDPTIYLARSEDEYLFPAGTTATQRLQRYASDWSIPLGALADTRIPLAKAVYRAQPIYNMILADLRETVAKGGKMYIPRMMPDGLGLVELGSNKTAWVLKTGQNLEEIVQRRSLEGVVTKVQVVGAAPASQRSPEFAFASRQTQELGTLQKILQKPQYTSVSQAKSLANKNLTGIKETITTTAIDINTIRAGDRVTLGDWELITVSVRHACNSPGRMTIELASAKHVKEVFYGQL